MFGINPSEFIVLVVVAAVILGPERLPSYAQQLTRLIRELRRMAQGASAQVREELGPEFDDIDWRKLDPRQYDPRRIVRDALSDVWDPDDPLGLKDDPLGLKTDSHPGPTDDSPRFVNPVRYGASDTDPDSAPADGTWSEPEVAAESDPEPIKPRSPGGPQARTAVFDPDAT